MLLLTGEDVPRGQSIRGRTLIVEVTAGDIDVHALTIFQAAAAEGRYASAMGGFLRWIARDYEARQQEFKQRVANWRPKATTAHARTPTTLAELQAAFEFLTRFAADVGAIAEDAPAELESKCWQALNDVAGHQRAHQMSSDPARRFISCVRGAIAANMAYVEHIKGGQPEDNPEFWGWRVVTYGNDGERWVFSGKRIGWIEGNDVYLNPEASFTIAQQFAQSAGEPLAVQQTTLAKRLSEAGLLASREELRRTLTIRKSILGRPLRVLHLLASTILEE